MARINIEDSLFTKNGFTKLAIKLGSRRAALGAIVEAFILAQAHYLDESNDRLIPFSAWEKEEISVDLVECGFAEKREKGMYVSGSKEQFAWLIQAQNAGIKSGEARASKSNGGSTIRSTPVNVGSTSLNGDEPLTPTLPLSPSPPHSLAHSQTLKISPKRKSVQEPVEKTLGSKIWEEYAEAYEVRYGTPPVRNAAGNAKCTQIAKRLGEDAPAVARFFVSHNRQFYVLKSHPIGMLLADAEGLHTEWVKGKQTTSTEARAAETKQQVVNVWAKHLEPETEK